MKIKNFLVTGIAATVVAASSSAFGQNVTVVVNGQPVNFQDQQPVMENDRVFVPLRGVFESLGAHVEWEPSTQTVTAVRGQTRIQLTIGQTTASVDGRPVQLDVPAQVLQGSTMVPLRFVGEALGNNVRWDSNSNTVIISGGGGNMDNRDHPNRDRRDQGHPMPPPIYVPVPTEEFPQPVRWHRDSNIPITFGLNFDFGSARQGQRFNAEVPNYQGLPPHSHAEGTITNITTINNVRKVTINYTTIVTPGGRRIPIQGQSQAAVPRGGHGGPPPNFAIHLTRGVTIAPRVHPAPAGRQPGSGPRRPGQG